MFYKLTLTTILFTLISCTDAFGTSLLNQRSDLVKREGGWGWGGSSGSLDSLVSLLTLLSFAAFLGNLLLNALLLLSSLFGVTATGGTNTGGGTTTTGGTSTSTGGTTTGTVRDGAVASVFDITGDPAGGAAIGVSDNGITLIGTGRENKGIYVGRKRLKRSAIQFQVQLPPRDVANIMSTQLIDVVDAFSSSNENCLHHILCLTNKRAITTGNGFQYLMPLCSFGLSYFGNRFGIRNNLFKHIEAIYHGIEDNNCKKSYPDCSQV